MPPLPGETMAEPNLPPRSPLPNEIPDPLAEALPEAINEPAKRRVIPLVWIVPIIAALVGGWLAFSSFLARGPRITISFETAEGIEVNKTRIKYKNVDMGVVYGVSLSPDRQRVLVHAELRRDMKDVLVEGTRFWVVRPRVALGSVSGLGTLLSGPYIGMDIGKSARRRDEFVGLEVPPVVTTGLRGRHFTLRTWQLGSLDIGSPIYYRRLRVGQVTAYALEPDGRSIKVRIFIEDPYQRYVTQNSRFWHASGMDVRLDANGFRISTESLATIIAGGIAFQTPRDEETGPPSPENAEFKLASSRNDAMSEPTTGEKRYLVYFTDSLRGLSVGAPVDFRGITIGEVKYIGMEYQAKTRNFRFPVEIALYPEQMRSRVLAGRTKSDEPPPSDQLIDDLADQGLRAQLRSSNLLTGQLYVALDFFPKAGPAKVDRSRAMPVLASQPNYLGQIQDSVASIAAKIDRMPLEEIGQDLRRALQDLDDTIKRAGKVVDRVDRELAPQASAALEQARRTFQAGEQVLREDTPLQQDLRNTLQGVRRAADSLRNLTDYLERHPETLLRGKPDDPRQPEPVR
ncbi:PqiB family protein [Chitinimonas lacunae]|uniref:Intermembrane transport protein PqiB n=1 Tax=Chitinimonas lacunae TaxID=1963018 RepID=A0ABV8MNG3_9NEIS